MTPDGPPTTVLRLRPDRTQRLEALLIGAGPHLEAVLDVGSAANGDLLVVLAAPAAHLTPLLEASDGLTPGEAVTVLAPLAQALARMHRAGVAHGGIRPGAVVLDADGSPSWTAPLAPTLRRSVGATAFEAREAEDVAAFRALAAALLGPAAPAAADLDSLEAALFAVAAPEPVRLDRREMPAPRSTPARLLPAAVPTAAPDPRVPEQPGAIVRRVLASVRPRVWVGLGAVVALLGAALVLLPADGSTTALPAFTTSPRSAEAAPRNAGSQPASPRAIAAPVAGRGLAADDAVARLLAARERCLRTGSAACLREVDAVGSPVLDADLRAVASGADAVHVDADRLTVTAAGATALATADGGTVLAIRDRNEWRLRDVVAEPPSSG